MHRELQRSLNPFLLVWNPSFYSLISYGCFQSHLQFRDVVPMPLSLKWSPYIEWFKTKTLNRNDTILELTENSLNLLINPLCWRSYLNSRSCAHTRSCDSRSVHPTTFTGGWGCPISIMCRSLTSSFHCPLTLFCLQTSPILSFLHTKTSAVHTKI